MKPGWAPTPRQWGWVAAVVFVGGCAQLFSVVLGEDLRRVVPANVRVSQSESQGQGDWDSLGETDLRFVVWLIARNAWTFTHAPTSLFEAEPCAPAHDALAFGEPGLALGLLAAPIALVVGDPLATFNATLVVMTLLAALALFLLIREWTASPPAGIVAGVLYAFHVLKIGDVVHVIIWDTAWTAFALYFATRAFRTGSWRACLGLAASVGMQLAGSLYPLMAAALIGLALGAWLVVHYGVQRIGALRLSLVLAAIALLATSIFAPYLQQTGQGAITEAAYQVYRPLSYVMPGGAGFSGWLIVGLALLGLGVATRPDAGGTADPEADVDAAADAARGAHFDGADHAAEAGADAATEAGDDAPAPRHAPVALPRAGSSARFVVFLAAALIFALTVVGQGEPGQATQAVLRGQSAPDGFPNLYLWLSALIPGLDAVRGPGAMYGGVHLLLCVLAGLGAAVLIERAPARHAFLVSALLIALALLDTLRPSALGMTPRSDYAVVELRPDAAALALFDALAAQGDRGPLLEYPTHHQNFWKSSRGVLLTAYHHRRTSWCYNSFFPAVSQEVADLSAQLPDVQALRRLYAMGFRTLIVHHAAGELGAEGRRQRFADFARGAGRGRIEPLAGNAALSAYRIVE